jgi:hypothetical protein
VTRALLPFRQLFELVEKNDSNNPPDQELPWTTSGDLKSYLDMELMLLRCILDEAVPM